MDDPTNNKDQKKGFLEELQSLSGENKKRLLIVSTIIIMVIVIGVWASYFNGIIAGNSVQASAQANAADSTGAPTAPAPIPTAAATQTAPATPASPAAPGAASAPSGQGAWQHIQNGFASIANIFKGSSNYSIQPQ